MWAENWRNFIRRLESNSQILVQVREPESSACELIDLLLYIRRLATLFADATATRREFVGSCGSWGDSATYCIYIYYILSNARCVSSSISIITSDHYITFHFRIFAMLDL